jgi:hypothetical protein
VGERRANGRSGESERASALKMVGKEGEREEEEGKRRRGGVRGGGALCLALGPERERERERERRRERKTRERERYLEVCIELRLVLGRPLLVALDRHLGERTAVKGGGAETAASSPLCPLPCVLRISRDNAGEARGSEGATRGVMR